MKTLDAFVESCAYPFAVMVLRRHATCSSKSSEYNYFRCCGRLRHHADGGETRTRDRNCGACDAKYGQESALRVERIKVNWRNSLLPLLLLQQIADLVRHRRAHYRFCHSVCAFATHFTVALKHCYLRFDRITVGFRFYFVFSFAPRVSLRFTLVRACLRCTRSMAHADGI